MTPIDRDCAQVSRLLASPTSPEAIDRTLREAGYDPEAVRTHFRAVIDRTLREAGYAPEAVRTHFRAGADRAIAKAQGLAYRVNCYRQEPRMVCGLSEWHKDLASALEGLAEQQQKRWSSVALVPQPPAPPPYQEQLGFALEE